METEREEKNPRPRGKQDRKRERRTRESRAKLYFRSAAATIRRIESHVRGKRATERERERAIHSTHSSLARSLARARL